MTDGSLSGGFSTSQVVDLISSVARSCERMTESAVAMLAGEMIETDIKAAINFNQDQRSLLGNKIVDQVCKKFTGMRQRLNYIVRNSTNRKQVEKLKSEKDQMKLELVEMESNAKQSGEVKVSDRSSECPPHLLMLLEKCRVDVLCLLTDIARVDIHHVEAKLRDLNTALQHIVLTKHMSPHVPQEKSINSYCQRLSVQAAAMFEMARMLSDNVDLPHVLRNVEQCVNSTSGSATSIEDLSLRHYTFLVSHKLLITYELDQLFACGQWSGESNMTADFSTRALIADVLQRIDNYGCANGSVLTNAGLNSYFCSVISQNSFSRQALDSTMSQSSFVSKMAEDTDSALLACLHTYCSAYTSDLVNFGSINIGEVDSLLSRLTNDLSSRVKVLIQGAKLSQLTSSWLYEQVCTLCDKIFGLNPKGRSYLPHQVLYFFNYWLTVHFLFIDPPLEMAELAARSAMLELKLGHCTSLLKRRQSSNLSSSLISEASKLAGLSSELAKRSAIAGSVEEKICTLAQELERCDRVLSLFTGHYTDTVQQVGFVAPRAAVTRGR